MDSRNRAAGGRAFRALSILAASLRTPGGLPRALVLLVALVALGAAPPESGAPRRAVTWAGRTMGTYANVTVVCADSQAVAPLAGAAQAALQRVDSLMSNWTTTSEVARINRTAAIRTTRVEPEVAVVLERALRLWRESDGAFDITVEPLVRLWGFLGGPRRVPGDEEIRATLGRVGAQHVHFDPRTRHVRFDRPDVRIDLGGIAKGYAVDRAAAVLRRAGVTDALVDLTGNMVALGHPPGAAAWRIGIRDPRGRLPYFARLPLENAAISTSGQYEQFVAAGGKTYGHILNPRTGYPVDGLISVTVVSPSAFTCDAWDTPLFVLGPAEAKRKAKAHEELEVVLVEPGSAGVDTVWVESSLRDRFVLEPAAADRFRVLYF